MSVTNGEFVPFGFCDIRTASAVVKEYLRIYPGEGFVPEIQKCCDGNGYPLIVNVPVPNYETFDIVFASMTGG